MRSSRSLLWINWKRTNVQIQRRCRSTWQASWMDDKHGNSWVNCGSYFILPQRIHQAFLNNCWQRRKTKSWQGMLLFQICQTWVFLLHLLVFTLSLVPLIPLLIDHQILNLMLLQNTGIHLKTIPRKLSKTDLVEDRLHLRKEKFVSKSLLEGDREADQLKGIRDEVEDRDRDQRLQESRQEEMQGDVQNDEIRVNRTLGGKTNGRSRRGIETLRVLRQDHLQDERNIRKDLHPPKEGEDLILLKEEEARKAKRSLGRNTEDDTRVLLRTIVHHLFQEEEKRINDENLMRIQGHDWTWTEGDLILSHLTIEGNTNLNIRRRNQNHDEPGHLLPKTRGNIRENDLPNERNDNHLMIHHPKKKTIPGRNTRETKLNTSPR